MKLLFLLLVIGLSWTDPTFADSPPTYYLTLVTIQESEEVIAVIGTEGFTTMASLKNYIVNVLPKGARIAWRAADNPPNGWKKFTTAWDELKQFCAEQGRKFVIYPAPFL